MKQDHSYPDPAQLRTYADDPMPFTDVDGYTVTSDGDLKAGSPEHPVTYTYEASYVSVHPEDESEGAYNVTEMDGVTVPHGWCWMNADHVVSEEDYVTADGYIGPDKAPHPGRFSAFWILSEVTITSNK